MEAKTFEIRDAMTFIPALGVRLDPGNDQDQYLLARAGFGRAPVEQGRYVVLIRLSDQEATYDPHGWRGSFQTMPIAHQHIIHHWDELKSGAVIDVEHLLGKSAEPKQSEAVTEDLF